jgi:hypothetical protein
MVEFKENDRVIVVPPPPPIGEIVRVLDDKNTVVIRWPSGFETTSSLDNIKKVPNSLTGISWGAYLPSDD